MTILTGTVGSPYYNVPRSSFFKGRIYWLVLGLLKTACTHGRTEDTDNVSLVRSPAKYWVLIVLDGCLTVEIVALKLKQTNLKQTQNVLIKLAQFNKEYDVKQDAKLNSHDEPF